MMSLKSIITKVTEHNNRVKAWIERNIHLNDKVYNFFQSLLLVLLGCLLAAVIQSSSILTCFLVPFAAKELISLNIAYNLTLGINIGKSYKYKLKAKNFSRIIFRNNYQLAHIGPWTTPP